MNRNLDNVYFRVERNGELENICFSDLTEKEMDLVLSNKNSQWMDSLINIEKKTLDSIVSYAEGENLMDSSRVGAFSNITNIETEEMPLQQKKDLSKRLGLTIRSIGDFFDIGCKE